MPVPPAAGQEVKKPRFPTQKWDLFLLNFKFIFRPSPVSNCSAVSKSSTVVRIKCQPGFSGGLKQVFPFEISK